MELIATRGISNSGKSTWAKQWLKGGENRDRVNRDIIREFLFQDKVDYSPEQEAEVTRWANLLIEQSLAAGQSVVVDNTHLHPLSLKELKDVAERFGAEFKVKQFTVDLNTALTRNEKRAAEGGLYVPEEVIAGMVTKLEEHELPEELAAHLI